MKYPNEEWEHQQVKHVLFVEKNLKSSKFSICTRKTSTDISSVQLSLSLVRCQLFSGIIHKYSGVFSVQKIVVLYYNIEFAFI